MAETTRSIPETGITDRFTGREVDEFGVDGNLSFEEKLQRFEEAEVSLAQAERYLGEGADKAEIYGDVRDVKDAISLLQSSANHHANEFREDELHRAAIDETVDPALLQAIQDRRDEKGHDQRPRSLSDYIENKELDRDIEPEPPLDKEHDRER